MKYLVILFLFIGTVGNSQAVDKIKSLEKKVRSTKVISDIDAADLEIEILLILDDINEWQNKLIDELREKTVPVDLIGIDPKKK